MPPTNANGKNALIILASDSVEAAKTVVAQIERLGGRILHVYPPRVLIGEIAVETEGAVRALANVARVERGRADLTPVEPLGPVALQAVKGWNRNFAPSFRALKSGRSSEGMSWGAPGYASEGPVQPLPGHSADDHAAPFAGKDTSDYLIGKVAVNIIVVEGTLAQYTFTQSERDTIVAEIQDGLGWLGGIEPLARVSWIYELRQVALDIDPDHTSDFSEDTWRDAAMAKLSYGADWNGLEQFVRDRRDVLGADWSYAIFVTRFPLWHFAYAFKPRLVMNYELDGWGIDDMDRIVAHETGHVFGAGDEYAESKCTITERFGHLQVENGNCEVDAEHPVQCIMSHNAWAMCDYTRGQLGWRDSNGDSVLDPLDPVAPQHEPTWPEALLEWLRRLFGGSS
jgi:hypothetical protein